MNSYQKLEVFLMEIKIKCRSRYDTVRRSGLWHGNMQGVEIFRVIVDFLNF